MTCIKVLDKIDDIGEKCEGETSVKYGEKTSAKYGANSTRNGQLTSAYFRNDIELKDADNRLVISVRYVLEIELKIREHSLCGPLTGVVPGPPGPPG